MKRMVDNEKIESIGLNEYIIDSLGNKKLYASFTGAFTGTTLTDISITLQYTYCLKKHITEEIVANDLSDLKNYLIEYCDNFECKDILYDSDKSKMLLNRMYFSNNSDNFLSFVQNNIQENITVDSEIDTLSFSLLDVTTGHTIYFDL